jgi:hypothetical protein
MSVFDDQIATLLDELALRDALNWQDTIVLPVENMLEKYAELVLQHERGDISDETFTELTNQFVMWLEKGRA